MYIIGLVVRGKKQLFKLARYVPSIRDRINKELSNINETFEKDALHRLKEVPFVVRLPKNGLSQEEILNKVEKYVSLGKINRLWRYVCFGKNVAFKFIFF